MPIVDVAGNVISKASPPPQEIEKSINRDYTKYGEWSWAVHPSTFGHLSWKTLRTVYQLSSSVRPAVDSIAREVSHLPWRVMHKDMRYHPPVESKSVVDFLKRPNQDRQSLSTLLSMFITDLLVVGKGSIEKARGAGSGKITELVPRDATRYMPKYGAQGQILYYAEYKDDYVTEIGRHPKENLIYKLFTPTTYTMSSNPIIETIINEVSVLMLSIKSIGWNFVHDEIPPGLLHLGIIGEEALERAKASFEATKGIYNKGKIRVVDNVDKVDWVQFQRPFQEMQVAELLPIIERIVARNFGLSPVESSLQVERGSAEVGVRSSQSKLIFPLINICHEAVNLEVVDELNPDVMWKVTKIPQESFQERSGGYGLLWRSGIVSRNEVRLNIDLDAVEGGDVHTVLLGNEVVPLDPQSGLPLYRNPTSIPPSSQGGPRREVSPPAQEQESMLSEDDFLQMFDIDIDRSLDKQYDAIERRFLSKKKSSF